MLDVVPTLLDYAGVKPQPHGSAQVGRSMADLLGGTSKGVYPADEPVGYEAAGGAVLYLGDDKLVRSAPPYGDGHWRLYNLRNDPTETKDLSESQPELMQSMLADYAAYVRRNSVVEAPPGYDVIKQAQANAAKKN